MVRRGCKRSFRLREQKSQKGLLHHQNLVLHRCNPAFHRYKRDLAQLHPKAFCTLSQPLWGDFPESGDLPGQLSNSRRIIFLQCATGPSVNYRDKFTLPQKGVRQKESGKKVTKKVTKASEKSGTKKEPKPKLLSPDIFRWGRGLPHEGVGPKSSVCPSKPGKSNFFGGISRDLAGISGGRPKSLRKKSLGSIFVP